MAKTTSLFFQFLDWRVNRGGSTEEKQKVVHGKFVTSQNDCMRVVYERKQYHATNIKKRKERMRAYFDAEKETLTTTYQQFLR